ncbi:MAG: hypothetical protein ABR514_11280 [Chthoniobacterales bacterium]
MSQRVWRGVQQKFFERKQETSDKAAIFAHFVTPPMAEPKDPQNDPVRITPPQPPGATSGPREPVRINLPVRPPVKPAAPAPPPPSAAPPPPPPPRPSVAASPPAAPMPAPGLKKETARVGAMPAPEARPSAPVQMKKTQPLVTMPEVTAPPSVPLTVTSEPPPGVENIPMPLCWAVLGISALILILQIWNYFS